MTLDTLQQGEPPRLQILDASDGAADDFAADVRDGIAARRKSIPCRWLYDARGSQLFERICELPEYYPTRSEAEILRAHADELAAVLPMDGALVELGSGSATKTRLLIEALLRRHQRLHYLAIDISREILEQSTHALVREYPPLKVTAMVAEYRAGLRLLRRQAQGLSKNARQPSSQATVAPKKCRSIYDCSTLLQRRKLVLWLGSNVGNFPRRAAARFLASVRATLAPCDRLLLGVDVRKDRRVLQKAYDDSAGVTAEFNLNLLRRINRELSGHFDLDSFRHRVRWRERLGRIEMHLESKRRQRVRIDALGLEIPFRAGETIFTESSYKYDDAELAHLAAAAGFAIEQRWRDSAGRFAVALLAPLSA